MLYRVVATRLFRKSVIKVYLRGETIYIGHLLRLSQYDDGFVDKVAPSTGRTTPAVL